MEAEISICYIKESGTWMSYAETKYAGTYVNDKEKQTSLELIKEKLSKKGYSTFKITENE